MKTEFTPIEGGVCAPKGFLANGIHCGIRKNKDKKDLALILSLRDCAAASMYTKNKVKGAPILVTKRHLENGRARAVLVNSGNANTCNADGIDIAEAMCESLASHSKVAREDIIIASTGVIGQPLPLSPIREHMGNLVGGLSENGSHLAAEAIMTTDTVKKEYALSFTLGSSVCRIGGIAKGSGMIHPNMATMLSFITSDVSITPECLTEALREAVEDSFNMMSIDGDTSTNDMVSILCNGEAENPLITEKNELFETFKAALILLCRVLSAQLAKDGEGATKLLTCHVSGGSSLADARAVARTVISSALFKSAMFGQDANWGRVLCAIGYAPCEVDVTKIDVDFKSRKGSIALCRQGFGVKEKDTPSGIDEKLAREVLSSDEIDILIHLHMGEASATAWGCDLTYDYVKINGDYRT